MVRPAAIWWAAVAVAGLLVSGGRAAAGWIVISNDTPAVLIVQEATDGPAPLRPKTVRLLPGEVYREYHLGEGKKTVCVFDARTPDKPVYRGTVTWAAEELPLTLEPDGTKVKLVGAAKAAGLTKPAAVKASKP